MQLNVLNDLVEAMKALDGKKNLVGAGFFCPGFLPSVFTINYLT